MANQRNGKPARRRDKPGAGGGRRKPCLFCKDKVEYADYKDLATRSAASVFPINSSRLSTS